MSPATALIMPLMWDIKYVIHAYNTVVNQIFYIIIHGCREVIIKGWLSYSNSLHIFSKISEYLLIISLTQILIVITFFNWITFSKEASQRSLKGWRKKSNVGYFCLWNNQHVPPEQTLQRQRWREEQQVKKSQGPTSKDGYLFWSDLSY